MLRVHHDVSESDSEDEREDDNNSTCCSSDSEKEDETIGLTCCSFHADTENLSASDESNDSCDSDIEDGTQSSPRKTHLKQVQIAQPPRVLEPYHHIRKVFNSNNHHFGYRICGDNIDKTVKSRYMRLDRRNKSLHYFHSYAVQNRINFNYLTDKPNAISQNLSQISNAILSSSSDDMELRKNISILISRILIAHVKYFSVTFEDLVIQHYKAPVLP